MKYSILLSLCLASCMTPAGNRGPRATQQFAADRPNIIIILADDMGYSDLSCMGSEIETPNLDRLAREGMLFTQFYNTARCCPTRAALLTGLYSHQADVGHMTGDRTDVEGYRNDLSHNAHTIAEVMKTAGYSTYMCGKWHVTSKEMPKSPKDNWPRQRGFDHYYGTIQGGGSYWDPAMLTRENTPITPIIDPDYQPDHFYYTDALGDNAAMFIQMQHDQDATQPFFMYLAFTSPHWPLHAPPETIAKYKGKYDGGYEPIRRARFERQKQLGIVDPKWELSPPPWKWDDQEKKDWEARCMEVYAAQVDRMDQNVGKVIKALEDKGAMDNTLIFFLSDNGGCAEDMGRFAEEKRRTAVATQPMKPDQVQTSFWPRFQRNGEPIRNGHVVMPGGADSFIAYGQGWANVSNTPFREYKHFVHEGGISTPLIAHWPAKLSRHDVKEREPGHVIDLMATCIELSGAKPPQQKVAPQGASLVPLLTGGNFHRENPIFWEHEGNRAVRSGEWKLVAKGVDGKWELYNIPEDRSEMHDLADKEPQRVADMSAMWDKWAKENHVLPMLPWVKKKPG